MSEEKMEHSPLPWHCYGNGIGFSDARQECCGIPDSSGGCCGSPNIEWEEVQIASTGSDADAEFITRACNAYYDNQAAIKELVDVTSSLLRHCRHLQSIIPGDDVALFRDMESASKLIAKHKASA